MSRWLLFLVFSGALLLAWPLHTGSAVGPAALSAAQNGPDEEAVAEACWKKSLKSAFHRAAARYDVPYELLVVLADQNSGLSNRGAAPSIDNGFGVMGLKDNAWGGQSLPEAAALLGGADPEVIKINPYTNIYGAAAVLDLYAIEAGIDRSQGLDAWLPVVIRYAGLEEDCARIFARSVYSELQMGLEKVNAYGEKFSVSPQASGVDLNSLLPAAVAPMVAPTDCGNPDYSGAIWDPAPSCNYSAISETKDTVVVHVAEGSAAACINTFKSCASGVSAHYVLDLDGTVYQMVCEKYRAWHVPCGNSRCIGLEHAGYTSDTSHPQAMYQGSANLVRDICNRWGIAKEHNRVYPGILAHIDITEALVCGSHTDPGKGWEWDHYIALINQQSDPYVYIVESRSGGKNYSQYAETGSWFNSSAKANLYGVTTGIGTRGAYASGGTPNTAAFKFTPGTAGQYKVFATWPTSTNSTTQGEFRITHAGGTASVVKNLNSSSNPAGQNFWNLLGTYTLNAGTQYSVTLTDQNYKNGWVLRSDSAKWMLVGGGGCVAPAITQHPSNQSVSPGGTATFTVAASGTTPFSYQWQKNQVNLTNGGHYSGVLTATLTISSCDSGDAATYRCIVTNSCGSATSNGATLTINATPTVFIVESRSGGKNYAKYSETGTWYNSTAKSTASGCTAGIGSRFCYIGSSAGKATFSFTPTTGGSYKVYTTNCSTTNSGNPLVHKVTHAGGTAAVNVCQNTTCGSNACNKWYLLGTYTLNSGTAYTVVLDGATTAGSLPSGNAGRSDAIKWESQ